MQVGSSPSIVPEPSDATEPPVGDTHSQQQGTINRDQLPPAEEQQQAGFLGTIWSTTIKICKNVTSTTIKIFKKVISTTINDLIAEVVDSDKFEPLKQQIRTLYPTDGEKIITVLQSIAQSIEQKSDMFKNRPHQIHVSLLNMFITLHTTLTKIDPSTLCQIASQALGLLHTFLKQPLATPSKKTPTSDEKATTQNDSTTPLNQELGTALLKICLPTGAESLTFIRTVLVKNFVYKKITSIIQNMVPQIRAKLVSKEMQDFITENVLDAIHSTLGTSFRLPGKELWEK